MPVHVVIQKMSQNNIQFPFKPTRKNTAALRNRLVPSANRHSSKTLKIRYARGVYKPSLRSLRVNGYLEQSDDQKISLTMEIASKWAYLLNRGLPSTIAGTYATAVKPGRVAHINNSEDMLLTFVDVLR